MVCICWRSPHHWANGIIYVTRGTRGYVTTILYDCRNHLQLPLCKLFTRHLTKGLIFRIHWKEMKISSLIKVSVQELWVAGLLTCSSWTDSQAHHQLAFGTESFPFQKCSCEGIDALLLPRTSVYKFMKRSSGDLQNDFKGFTLVIFLHVGVSFLLFLARGLPWENMNWALKVSVCLLCFIYYF